MADKRCTYSLHAPGCTIEVWQDEKMRCFPVVHGKKSKELAAAEKQMQGSMAGPIWVGNELKKIANKD